MINVQMKFKCWIFCCVVGSIHLWYKIYATQLNQQTIIKFACYKNPR